MTDRIQKILSQRGVASRRHAEEMIAAGRVLCNGRVCTLGQSADPENDDIRVDGVPLPSTGKKIYLMLHKPKGYVTTLSDEKGRKNAAMLVESCGQRVFSVGRLDMDSEGLLIFTNDGELANTLMHPRHQVEKVYRVTVKGYTENNFARLGKPIYLDGYKITPPKLTLEAVDGECAVIQITIHEGRNRQVRRMCARAGMSVRRLVRIREGNLQLGDLPCGKWRYLTEREVEELRK